MKSNSASIHHLCPPDTQAGSPWPTAAKIGPLGTGSAEVDKATHALAQGDVERVFGHWVLMMGKAPTRCALGPARQKVISKALGLYDAETLMLAIEGCACDAWHAGQNDRNKSFQDIELILRDEAHIERFAEAGEQFRARADRAHAKLAAEEAMAAAAAAAQRTGATTPSNSVVVAVAREKLNAMRAEMAARMRQH